MSDLRLQTIARGYQRAYARLQTTYSRAYMRLPNTALDQEAAEEVWAALFETLNWLDALQLHPDAAAVTPLELRNALRFVRGRVHHQFADAIEFRDDVIVHLAPISARPGPRGPVAIADWCWLQTADLRGGRRSSSARSRERSGETDYENALARRQARSALDQIASMSKQLLGD